MDRIASRRQHHEAVSEAAAEVPDGKPGLPRDFDPDVVALVGSIAALAKGNTKEEVELVSGEASTHEVGLNLRLELGWEWTSEGLKGAPAIQGSVGLANHDQVEAFLEEVCSSDCRDLARSARMLAAIRKEPAAAFLSWPETWTIGSLPHAAHHVVRCTECSATGMVRCLTGCRNGSNPCPACKSTGVAICFICAGHRGGWVDGHFKNCKTCSGTGHHGQCGSCNSSGHVTCIYCSGQGKVECSACAGTATRTVAYSTSLVGHLSRSVVFDPGLPDAFRCACETLSRSELVEEGDIDRVDGSSGAATAEATLRLQVRHVNTRLRCGEVGIEVDAVGQSRRIPVMPNFLDIMLAEAAETITQLSRHDPAECLEQAKTTRLGCDLLTAAGRGERTDPAAVSRRWLGAASPVFVSAIGDALHLAYSRAARVAVRRSWLAASPWLVGAAFLANIYHLPGALGLAARPMHPAPLSGLAGFAAAVACEAAVMSPFLLAAWFLAGLRGRRALAAALGGLARRRPRQGFWPQSLAVVTVACGLATSWTGLDAASLGLPLALGQDGHGRPMAKAAADYIPAFASLSGQAAPGASNAPGLQHGPVLPRAEIQVHGR